VFGEDKQQLIVDADGCVNLFVDFLSTLDIFRGVPASDTTIMYPENWTGN
jgi:hypothetical protein